MFYSLARHFTLTLPLSTLGGGGGWEVSYRQTLRETLVKAGITNPLQWVFRLVGWWDVSQSLIARKYTIFLNLLSGRGLDSYRVGHLAWIWCCTTSCFRRNELKRHPLNNRRDLPKDELGISITTS